MNAPLPPALELVVSLLIPAPCREEVVGDLYESCGSRTRFVASAIRVIPMVVLSRIRRTADLQLVVIQAASLLLCFLGAAQLEGEAEVVFGSGLLRFVIPVSVVLIGSLLEGAYARPFERWSSRVLTGPLFGGILAYAAQSLVAFFDPQLILPGPVLLYGAAAGSLFCAAIKMSFPVTLRSGKHGISPIWRASGSPPARNASRAFVLIKVLFIALVLAWAGRQLNGSKPALIVLVLGVAVLVFREISKT